MALPITQTIHYTPKVPPETNCICFYQQLPICCCEDWINAGAETADLVAVTEAATVANANAAAITATGNSGSPPSPALPLYAAPGPYFFPNLLFDAPVAQSPHHHQQQSPQLQHHSSPFHQNSPLQQHHNSPLQQSPLLQHHHSPYTTHLHHDDSAEPLSPWSPPGFHASSPDDASADLSSSACSPAGAASLAGSPENYALSPASSGGASSAFGWPAAAATTNAAAGYGDLYSSSPIPVDTITHKIAQDDKLPCDLCPASFATRKEFKRHQSVAHSRGLAFRCRVEGCTKAKSGHVYNRRDNFVRHLRTAHARAEGADVEGMVKACAFVRGDKARR